ncbi:peptidase, partial [Candidatus Nitrosotenuis uzonensis]|uniref:peptidase n=1 Tax=Candidatus Nitrosotenuis uzonensis TaxID=1407055 RepID=UPI00195F8E90
MNPAGVLLALFFIIVIPSAGVVYGHGLGMDMAPPIDFEGMQVTILTTLEPRDMTVGKVDSANIGVRFYDTLTDKNLNSVTYRVEVWQNDKLHARNLFFDKDGQLDIEIKPKTNCTEAEPWRCTVYYGEKDLITGGLTQIGNTRPLIQGPIFDKGGLYNIKVIIDGATSPKALVAEPLLFETFVSVAQEQDFIIKTASAQEIPVIVKTYYDDVDNFTFDNSKNSISFDMPFNWDPSYVQLVQVVHEEIRLPKSFDPYAPGKELKGYVNGIEVDNRILLVDPYSYDDHNVIHFLVTGAELERINSMQNPALRESGIMKFQLLPQGSATTNSAEIKIESGATAKVSWPASYGAGNEIPFEFSFFDANKKLLKDVHYGYELLDGKGNRLAFNTGSDPNMLGILASEGIDIKNIPIPAQGIYKFRILILGQGMPMNQQYAGIGEGIIEIGPAGQQSATLNLPPWIKNNAK